MSRKKIAALLVLGVFVSGTKEWVAGMTISYFPLGVAQGLGNGILSR
jgi:hypothetical protein